MIYVEIVFDRIINWFSDTGTQAARAYPCPAAEAVAELCERIHYVSVRSPPGRQVADGTKSDYYCTLIYFVG